MRKIFAILLITFYTGTSAFLFGQDSTEAPAETLESESSSEPETSATWEDAETAESSTGEATENAESTVDESSPANTTTDSEKKEKGVFLEPDEDSEMPPPEINADDYELANPRLIDEYTKGAQDYNYPEHFMINMFMGGFSGAAIGALSGLAMYDSTNTTKSEENLYLSAGAFAITGLITGGIVSWVEYADREQFTVGPVVMNYAWYGALSGALAGAAIGVIPYSSSQNTDDILNFTGYGAAAGLLTGMIMFFVQMPENLELTAFASGESMSFAFQQKF